MGQVAGEDLFGSKKDLLVLEVLDPEDKIFFIFCQGGIEDQLLAGISQRQVSHGRDNRIFEIGLELHISGFPDFPLPLAEPDNRWSLSKISLVGDNIDSGSPNGSYLGRMSPDVDSYNCDG